MRGLVVAILALIATTNALAQDQRWPTREANLYWPLKQERIDAYRERDRARMERLLSPSFIGMGADGRHATRDEYLNAEFSTEAVNAPRVETEVEDFRATRTGSTLMLAYRETERADIAGQPYEARLARLDVYVRQNGRWLLQTMTAVRLPTAPTAIEVSETQLRAYVGVYEYGPGVTSTVRLVDGRLREQSTGSEEVDLIPVGEDEFYSPPDLDSRASFERDADGRVVTQVYRSGGQTLRARRLN